MTTRADQIIAWLALHPEGADDGQLARELGLGHAHVNRTCRSLAEASLVKRLPLGPGRKLRNYFVTNAPACESAPVLQIAIAVVLPVRRLETDRAIQSFAYEGERNVTEDRVKRVVEVALQREGWKVITRLGREHGIDIDATKEAERLIIEAKGEGTLNPMRVNFFLGALGELIQRMDSPDARYGLALPAHRQFIGLIVRLPAFAKAHLRLCFYLVKPVSETEFEVGLIPTP